MHGYALPAESLCDASGQFFWYSLEGDIGLMGPAMRFIKGGSKKHKLGLPSSFDRCKTYHGAGIYPRHHYL